MNFTDTFTNTPAKACASQTQQGAAPAASLAGLSPIHHVILVEVSTAMREDLPALRLQLKNVLNALVWTKDAVSCILVFDGGRVCPAATGLKVTSKADLVKLQTLIDKIDLPAWLSRSEEPLLAVEELVTRADVKLGSPIDRLAFIADGFCTQVNEEAVLAFCERVKHRFEQKSVLEYGWSANRPVLQAMTNALQGELLYCATLKPVAPEC